MQQFMLYIHVLHTYWRVIALHFGERSTIGQLSFRKRYCTLIYPTSQHTSMRCGVLRTSFCRGWLIGGGCVVVVLGVRRLEQFCGASDCVMMLMLILSFLHGCSDNVVNPGRGLVCWYCARFASVDVGEFCHLYVSNLFANSFAVICKIQGHPWVICCSKVVSSVWRARSLRPFKFLWDMEFCHPKTSENYCIMKLFCAVVHCVSPIFSVSLCDIHSPTSICCKLAAVLYGDCLA